MPPSLLFRSSPARANRDVADPVSYSSTSTLLQEISSLRSRLKELEDDTKSSVVSSGIDEHDGLLSNMLRKDISKLEEEKATEEKDFLNQLSTLSNENQKRISELQSKLAESEALNYDLNNKLLSATEKEGENVDTDKEQLVIMLDELRGKHSKEIEQMKSNLASADLEIAESRGEIDHLQEQLEELQTHRETLIEEVTSCKIELSEEQRKTADVKSELSKAKLTVEKLQNEVKGKDEKIELKSSEIKSLKEGMEESRRNKKKLDEASKTIESLQAQVKEKDADISQKIDDIGEMNDAIIKLQGHKEMLLSEITDMKVQSQKQNLPRNASSSNLKSNTQGSDDSDGSCNEKPITPLEKQALEQELNILGERLAIFRKKFSEKDHQIETLSNSLLEERLTNKKLRAELKTLDATSVLSKEARSAAASNEISFLRNQNKLLNEEIKSLRKTNEPLASGQDPRTVDHRSKQLNCATRKHDTDESPIGTQRSGQFFGAGTKSATEPISSSQASERTKTNSNTPRTPVSGLVASFERRIASKKQSSMSTSGREEDEDQIESMLSALDYNDFKQELEGEKSLSKELEVQLDREKAVAAELTKKLKQSQRDLRKIQARVSELEDSKKLNDEEVNRLRSEIVYIDIEREDREKRIAADDLEIQRLQREIDKAHQSVYQEEKKESDAAEEIKFLEEVIRQKDEALDALKEKLKKEEDIRAEEISRLRSDISQKEQEHKEVLDVLLKEVSNKDSEIEIMRKEITDSTESNEAQVSEMQSELTNIGNRLASALSHVQENEIKLNRLQTELEELDVEKTLKEDEIQRLNVAMEEFRTTCKEVEDENSKAIADLQSKIALLELNAETGESEKAKLQKELEDAENKINTEVSPVMQKRIDDEREVLAVELAKAQIKHAELDAEHTTKLKEMEETIKSLETKLLFEKEEKNTLKGTFEEMVTRSENEPSPKIQRVHDSEINRITVELTKTQIKQADLEREYTKRVRDLEIEIEDLEAEAEEELKQKDREIFELRRTLETKEDEIQRLEQDRSQLCSSMNDLSFSRKDEVHELQAEIIDLSTKTKSQEREIQTLKMRIDDSEKQIDGASSKYIQRIKDLEDEMCAVKTSSDNMVEPEALTLMKSENMKLREYVRELKLERRSLNERLEVLMSERNGSKSSQVLQKRNIALKEEVEKLTKRLKKLEASITRFAI